MTIATAPRKRTKMEVASQIAVFVGAMSMVWVGGGNPWGFVVAMLIQPFWYYTSIYNRQWGLVSASTIYTFAWARGIYHNWLALKADTMQFFTAFN